MGCSDGWVWTEAMARAHQLPGEPYRKQALDRAEAARVAGAVLDAVGLDGDGVVALRNTVDVALRFARGEATVGEVRRAHAAARTEASIAGCVVLTASDAAQEEAARLAAYCARPQITLRDVRLMADRAMRLWACAQ